MSRLKPTSAPVFLWKIACFSSQRTAAGLPPNSLIHGAHKYATRLRQKITRQRLGPPLATPQRAQARKGGVCFLISRAHSILTPLTPSLFRRFGAGLIFNQHLPSTSERSSGTACRTFLVSSRCFSQTRCNADSSGVISLPLVGLPRD